MKATIEISEGEFSVEILSKKTRYVSKGTIVLDEDAKDLRDRLESMARVFISKSDNYTQSKSSVNK